MTGQIIQLGRSDSITDVERPWVRAIDAIELDDIRAQLMASGLTPTVASGLTFWLLDQHERRRFVKSDTCSRYRQILATLGPPKIPGSLKTSRNAQLELPLEVAG